MDNIQMKVCIFNSNHMVPAEFYRQHIIRCRRHYRPRRIPCPYRPWESFSPVEMVHHMRTCPGAPRTNMTQQEHKAIYECHYPRDEFYPTSENMAINPGGEDDEDTGPPPVQCPFNREELIYPDKLRDHMIRCDYAEDYYRENPVISDPEWNSDSD